MTMSPHVLIVEARYYPHISDHLLTGATAALDLVGSTYDRITVPGAFEIPAAIKYAVQAGANYHGFVALGCVIRGETTHYDYVCEQCSRGLQDLALEYNLAIGFGILTVENEAQGLARARVDLKNKGGEAARACLEMVLLKLHFGIL
jgi:6,7-dimethyl-8-ribityllumazine synthase